MVASFARHFGRACAIHRQGLAGRSRASKLCRHLQRLSRHQSGPHRLHARGLADGRANDAKHEAPVPAEEWGAMTDYLMKNFPERQAAGGRLIDGPAKVDFKMWDVPTQGSRPHDPLAARDGSSGGAAQLVNKLGRVDPKTGAIQEYTLKSAFSGPHGLVDDKDGEHLVYRQPCRVDRQARSQHRRRDRISAAGPEGERSPQPQLRSERAFSGLRFNRPIWSAGLIRRPVRSSSLPHRHRSRGPTASRSTRRACRSSSNSAATRLPPSIRRRWRSRNTRCRTPRAAAAPGDRPRRHGLVCRLCAGIYRQA